MTTRRITRDGVHFADASQEAFERLYAPLGYWWVDPQGVRHTGSVTATADKATQIEKLNVYGYGHSYINSDVAGVAGGNAIKRATGRISATFVDRALSGSELASAAKRAIGTSAAKWVAGTKGLLYVDAILNQLNAAGYATAPAIAGMRNALTSFLSCCSAFGRVEPATATTIYPNSGAWTLLNNARYSGGSAYGTTTAGAYVEWTVAVNATGRIGVCLVGTVPGWFVAGSAFSIDVDGVTVYAGTEDSQFVTTGKPENESLCPMTIMLAGLTPGNHVVRVRKDGQAGVWFYLDCIFVRGLDSQIPPIFFNLQQRMDWPSYHGRAGGFVDVTQDQVDAMNDMIRTVAAAFPNVYLIDRDAYGWDWRTMIDPDDGVHPNDRGQAFLANLTEHEIRTRCPWTLGLHTGVAA